MSSDRDIVVLGTGMHPWGKWGRNFVEYGVVAAQAALTEAGVEWSDIQFVSGGETVRNQRNTDVVEDLVDIGSVHRRRFDHLTRHSLEEACHEEYAERQPEAGIGDDQ